MQGVRPECGQLSPDLDRSLSLDFEPAPVISISGNLATCRELRLSQYRQLHLMRTFRCEFGDATLKAVIFDLDGTLVDSAAAICANANVLMAERGWASLDVKEAQRFIGHGARRFLEQALAAREGAYDPGTFEGLWCWLRRSCCCLSPKSSCGYYWYARCKLNWRDLV